MSALVSLGWVPWALVGSATLLLARSAGARAVRGREPRRSARRGLSRPQLAGTAAATSAIACVAIGGWPSGVVAALGLAPLSGVLVRKIAGTTAPAGHDDALALALDLAAAVLASGQTLPDALALVAPVTPSSGSVLDRVAGLLRLGADPADAWSIVPPDSPVLPVARAAIRSEVSGARLAAAFERCADRIRADLHAAGVARASRAGTSALAPLAVCFLPSFICLGIVPAVLGIAKLAYRQVL